MNDAERYVLSRASLACEIKLFAGLSPGARLVTAPGVIASVVPSTPQRSVFNAVQCDGVQALRDNYEAVARAFNDAGVRAFTVWTDPDDQAQGEFLQTRGHKLDARPLAMVGDLDAMSLQPLDGLDAAQTRDVSLIGRINQAAYTFQGPAFDAALRGELPQAWRGYVARVAGEPACALMTCDVTGGALGISAVATLPAYRGQHLASRLLSHALREAQARGLRITTLEATSKGAPVYAKLGYRSLGAMTMWEHRV